MQGWITNNFTTIRGVKGRKERKPSCNWFLIETIHSHWSKKYDNWSKSFLSDYEKLLWTSSSLEIRRQTTLCSQMKGVWLVRRELSKIGRKSGNTNMCPDWRQCVFLRIMQTRLSEYTKTRKRDVKFAIGRTCFLFTGDFGTLSTVINCSHLFPSLGNDVHIVV